MCWVGVTSSRLEDFAPNYLVNFNLLSLYGNGSFPTSRWVFLYLFGVKWISTKIKEISWVEPTNLSFNVILILTLNMVRINLMWQKSNRPMSYSSWVNVTDVQSSRKRMRDKVSSHAGRCHKVVVHFCKKNKELGQDGSSEISFDGQVRY